MLTQPAPSVSGLKATSPTSPQRTHIRLFSSHHDSLLFVSAGLCDIQAVKDRALVAGCMHVFCLPCLQRWVTYKRFCPLCKVYGRLLQQ
jgi:hypothetical protein